MTQATSHTFNSPRQRSGLLRDQVKIAKRNGSDRYEIARIQDHLSFEKGLYIFIRACQLLAQQNDGIIFVGLAGPSGAGKTKFAEKVLEVMPSIAIIAMDNYNDGSRIIDGNFDDPRLTDYETLLGNIHGLKEGSSVQAPIYDFKTSSRIGYRTIEVPSSRIVIIEGIYALSDKLRPFLDLRVSVTGGVHFDIVKRVLRDIQRAGQEPEEIINQISETVYPMYKAFIEPDLQTAHVKIVNKFNPFTGFQNPTYILKSSKAIAEDKIKEVLSMDHEERIEETYDIYLLPPGEDPDTCQSYLRMRNRDGKYNLMFEEWVTDSPFIISPRITFEVSVRLLGGLMALGYTIATILKRSSHSYSNDSICVKTDWLEQINRKYVQVQGRDRVYVKRMAEQLGLDGSYVSRTYIEQIQLEKLVNDVMELPTDLKTKLSIDDDMLSSPKEALSRASADQRSRYLSRGSMTHSYSTQHKKSFSKLTKLVVDTNFDGSSLESPTSLPTQGVIAQVFEQISTLNVRMDDFASQLEMLNSEISARDAFPGQQNVALLIEASNGLASASLLMNGLGNGGLNGPLVHDSSSSSQLSRESSLMEEIFVIGRGQRQIMHQVDTLSNFFRALNGEKSRQERIYVRERNRDVDSISIPVVLTLAIGGLGIFLYRNLVSPR